MSRLASLVVLVTLASCGRRPVVIVGPVGPQGAPGTNGSDGTNGADGRDGIDGTNGQDGAQGPAGPTGPQGTSAVFEVIDPCGAAPGYNEVLLRFEEGGPLYALYYAPPRAFLAELPPGSYVTTDGTSCYFTVNANNEVQ